MRNNKTTFDANYKHYYVLLNQMKFNLMTYLLVLINLAVFGQTPEPRKFDDIIAVNDETNGKRESYYLTKSGKKFGKDSLEYYDNSPVCESEGFICFRDRKTDKAGMFNRNGDIVIPAKYNFLSKVVNGMSIGLIGAEKHYIDENDEHPSWKGGKWQVIDTTDKILIDDFIYKDHLNFYSLNFKSVEGKYYSFVDFEKEFRQWITKELLNDLTKERLIDISYNTVNWESQNGRVKANKIKLISDNFTILKKGLLEILQPNTDYFVSNNGLNPFIYEGSEFEKYFNNCGEPKDWIYPTMSIIISYNDKNDYPQNHYEFLRTDNGYKLISLTIREGEIK